MLELPHGPAKLSPMYCQKGKIARKNAVCVFSLGLGGRTCQMGLPGLGVL